MYDIPSSSLHLISFWSVGVVSLVVVIIIFYFFFFLFFGFSFGFSHFLAFFFFFLLMMMKFVLLCFLCHRYFVVSGIQFWTVSYLTSVIGVPMYEAQISYALTCVTGPLLGVFFGKLSLSTTTPLRHVDSWFWFWVFFFFFLFFLLFSLLSRIDNSRTPIFVFSFFSSFFLFLFLMTSTHLQGGWLVDKMGGYKDSPMATVNTLLTCTFLGFFAVLFSFVVRDSFFFFSLFLFSPTITTSKHPCHLVLDVC